MIRIRLIPALITLSTLLLCIKISDVMHDTEALAEQSGTAPAEKKEIPASADKTSKEAAPKTENAKGEKAKDDKKDDKKSEDKKGDKKDEKKEESKEDKGKKNPAVSDEAGDIVEHRFTPVELDLLQNLVKRREELDLWEKNVEIKEAALNATEKRLDDKIAQIDAMKKEVSVLLAQYNDKEDAKIRSLVKIYENMKPKDAARIFNEVEMPILLLVIDKMSEKKIAPILAEMDSKKAKQVTVQLAEQRRIGSLKMNNLSPTPGK